jgi:hypothetical protein
VYVGVGREHTYYFHHQTFLWLNLKLTKANNVFSVDSANIMLRSLAVDAPDEVVRG